MTVARASADRVAIVGAGIGGLAAAIRLASRGLAVTVFDKEEAPGGKARQLIVGNLPVAAGPTVLTLRRVFDRLFEETGSALESSVNLAACPLLARHWWPGGGRLDLFADPAASRDAIGAFSGAAAARGFDSFRAEAAHIWNTLADSFVMRDKTGPLGLTLRLGFRRLADLQACRPYETLWQVLRGHFADERLVQLYGRYATYCGASPFRAPATLMLIAHVESLGVWRVDGGIHALALAMARRAEALGARIRLGEAVATIRTSGGRTSGVGLQSGEQVAADFVIANVDPAALADGLFGTLPSRAVATVPPAARSLSAVTWMLAAEPDGIALDHHNLFFSPDSRAEFADLAAGRLPKDPTAYVCAMDRGDGSLPRVERFQIIVNAPPLGDGGAPTVEEIARCETRMLTSLRHIGLSFRHAADSPVRVTPVDYARLFPSTGGALYGRASHGWAASFRRPGSRTRIPGLYLAGGGIHPGAGVPMAAISGELASAALLRDRERMGRDSTAPSRPAAMPGGMWTPSPRTAATGSPSSPSSAPSSRPII
jgi:1-hydroxycarotenoid 3,4-desaturase